MFYKIEKYSGNVLATMSSQGIVSGKPSLDILRQLPFVLFQLLNWKMFHLIDARGIFVDDKKYLTLMKYKN